MELMDNSMEQLCELVYKRLKLNIPEDVVGKIAESVSSSLALSKMVALFSGYCLLVGV